LSEDTPSILGKGALVAYLALLGAMAVECLLKALALEGGAVLASGGRYKRIAGVKDHDLVGLATAVRFETTPAEAAILRPPIPFRPRRSDPPAALPRGPVPSNPLPEV
jgi:hypothetical protein